MPSRAIVVSIGIGFKVVILGGHQINNFYSKKLNPIFRVQVDGKVNVPKEEP
tara:strand:- start:398 stop:553 length:156 start_codon:yes stop_codon:yes gene_type:complete